MLKPFILFSLLMLTSAVACAEQVQLQTYYPSPYGIYKRVKLTPTTLPACDSGAVGSIAVSSGAIPGCTADQLCYCSASGWTSVGGAAGAWNLNGNNLYPASNGYNVGIGTITPQQKLSVSAGMNIDQANANSGTPTNALTFGSSSGEGIASKRTATGNQNGLDFYTGSANRMSITNSGDVGIGTNSPSTTLDVNGSLRIRGGAPVIGHVLTTTDTLGNAAWQAPASGGYWERTAPNLYPDTITDNVGIGTNTPQQRLSVSAGMNIDQANANSGTPTNALTFGSGSGEGIASKRTAGGNQFGLDFYTGSANHMSITNSGNVGIGTTNPLSNLHVEGSPWGTIQVKGNGIDGWILAASNAAGFAGNCPPGGFFCIMGRNPPFAAFPYVQVSPQGVTLVGSLGVGMGWGNTDTPKIPTGLSAAAEFNSATGAIATYGPAIFSDFANSGGYGRIVHTGAAGNFHIDSFTGATFINWFAGALTLGAHVHIGNGSGAHGTLTAATVNCIIDCIEPSSRKIKKNITASTYGLEAIQRLEPVRYIYTYDSAKKYKLGFIAEDVAQIIPEVVSTDETGVPSGINYGKLTPVLVNAIKELKKENDALKARIEALEQIKKENRKHPGSPLF